MSDFPDYSVVIPAYNASEFIAETIGTVMTQTHPPHEIIVVDDGSTDRLEAALADLDTSIVLIRQDNQGPGSATTRGAMEVRTEFLATLDADDLWHPDKIAKQFAALNPPDAEMVFTRMLAFGTGAHQKTVDTTQSGWVRSTMFLRLDTFHKIGPIEDMPGYHGEMIAWLDCARALGIGMVMLDELLARRRMHEGSLTWTRKDGGYPGYMEVVMRAMRRRKENQRK